MTIPRHPAVAFFAIGIVSRLAAADLPNFETASVKRAERCALQNTVDTGMIALHGDPLKAARTAGQVMFSAGPGVTGIKGSITMDRLVRFLSTKGYGQVEDATGLKGKYDIDLTWAPDRAFERGPRSSHCGSRIAWIAAGATKDNGSGAGHRPNRAASR